MNLKISGCLGIAGDLHDGFMTGCKKSGFSLVQSLAGIGNANKSN